MRGVASPEGSIPATVGSLYMRTDGAGPPLYIKAAGAGATGWPAPAALGRGSIAAVKAADSVVTHTTSRTDAAPKSVVEGKRVSVSVGHGGGRSLKKKKKKYK